MAALDGIDALVGELRRRIRQEGLRPLAKRTGIPIGQLRSVANGRAARYTTLQSIASVIGMRVFIGPVEPNVPDVSGATEPSRRPATTTDAGAADEPLADRVLRQVRSGTLDEARLLPSAEQRARDTGRKLDRLTAREGWYAVVAGQAHAVATGTALAKRSAEIAVVEQVTRWRSQVSRFAPERLAEFDGLIADALNNPAPVDAPGLRVAGRRPVPHG